MAAVVKERTLEEAQSQIFVLNTANTRLTCQVAELRTEKDQLIKTIRFAEQTVINKIRSPQEISSLPDAEVLINHAASLASVGVINLLEILSKRGTRPPIDDSQHLETFAKRPEDGQLQNSLSHTLFL